MGWERSYEPGVRSALIRCSLTPGFCQSNASKPYAQAASLFCEFIEPFFAAIQDSHPGYCTNVSASSHQLVPSIRPGVLISTLAWLFAES